MSNFLELSRLAAAVYGDVAAPAGWTAVKTTTGRYSFQATAYTKGTETVVAFRGTTIAAGDFAADLKLGIGMNTSHFSQAEAFASEFSDAGDLTVCGHSLGGAMAQIVGNRRQIKFATFNAPGVAIFASRNIMDSSVAGMGVRVAGATLGALLHPMQTARDIRATFNVNRGVNVCLSADAVSQIGLHYGKVVRIPGTGMTPWSQHGISVMADVLERNSVGLLTVESYFPPTVTA